MSFEIQAQQPNDSMRSSLWLLLCAKDNSDQEENPPPTTFGSNQRIITDVSDTESSIREGMRLLLL